MDNHIQTPRFLRTLFAVICTVAFSQVWKITESLFLRTRAVRGEIGLSRNPTTTISLDQRDNAQLTGSEEKYDSSQLKEMKAHKELYFKLQNLEQFPRVLQRSRDLLISLFSETLEHAHMKPNLGILAIKVYTSEKLASFIHNEHNDVVQGWEQYLARRKSGYLPEMFKNREEAKHWLKQVSPVKYVDGAWLGHVNRVTTPFALGRVSKDAWQVLSEELGDGDLKKNHVHVYRELMKDIEPQLPKGDSIDYIHPRHGLDEPRVWKAAVAQLLISLFPHDFLPEILGFNLHYEMLTLDTLKVANELKQFNLDPYYFFLHISIDNADSGHTAMAMQAIIKYMEHEQKISGSSGVEVAWKRIQAGFVLSAGLPTSPSSLTPSSQEAQLVESFPRNKLEADVVEIFKAKAAVAQKVHSSSQLVIGRRTLVKWLEPGAFASTQWQKDFLDDLSNSRPWIRKGNGGESRLVQELSWGGRMFGSFTQIEVEVVKRWIDSLGEPRLSPSWSHTYWSFIGQAEIKSDEALRNQDVRIDYPVFSPVSINDFSVGPVSSVASHSSAIRVTDTPDMLEFLPLWFSHPCLLQSYVSIPSRTASRMGCSIVRLLRAQFGFDIEGPGVAGMDEVRRTENVDLIKLGLEIMRRAGFPEPGSLKEVLENRNSTFALMMLHLSMRPTRNIGLLLGLAWAFVDLHDAMVSSTLLSATGRKTLGQIARRERDCLNVCLEELRNDHLQYARFLEWYDVGKRKVKSCFGGAALTADCSLISG